MNRLRRAYVELMPAAVVLCAIFLRRLPRFRRAYRPRFPRPADEPAG